MALDSVHPLYSNMLHAWEEMRDLYKGERHIKAKGPRYLPPTKSMLLDGMGNGPDGRPRLGQEIYDAYRDRAVLPDYVKEAVEHFIGILHSKPPIIELPPQMEPMREQATLLGESLELLLRRINEEQLTSGRLGLLLDMPKNPDPADPQFFIALYVAEAGRNWDDGQSNSEEDPDLNMVVLDESGYRRLPGSFDWDNVVKYRVLLLDDKDGPLSYKFGVFETTAGTPEYVPTDLKPAMLRGQTIDEIPFVFINTKDIANDPDEPPLTGLARLALAIYRGEADYRRNLHMQGDDTLVTIGDRKSAGTDINEITGTTDDEPLRVGSGSMIEMDQGGDAKYIGITSQGLAEQRTALENDRKRAEARSAQLGEDGNGTAQESGEAKKTRIAASTATLKQIALTGAGALEWLLKCGARWMGADESQVRVQPNLEFERVVINGDELIKLQTARTMGAPLSSETIHERMTSGGLTKLTYDEEMAKKEEEDLNAPPPGTDVGGNPAPADTGGGTGGGTGGA